MTIQEAIKSSKNFRRKTKRKIMADKLRVKGYKLFFSHDRLSKFYVYATHSDWSGLVLGEGNDWEEALDNVKDEIKLQRSMNRKE